MNDRFKFRYWCKTLNSFMVDYKNKDGDNSGSLHIFEDIVNSERYIVSQCTGLKDKNGKLIYEGDIIQIQGDTGKSKVEYNLEKGMFLLIGKKYAPSAFMTIRKDYWEVIGNIYENADLLQECDNV